MIAGDISQQDVPVIRAHAAGDYQTLGEIYHQTRLRAFHWLPPDSISIEDFARDTEGERIWVAEVNAQVIGFISVWEPENFIHHLYVLPAFAGRNVGSQLLQTCLAYIGYPARLKCVSANTRALQFYRARGWQTLSVDMGPEGEYQLMQINA